VQLGALNCCALVVVISPYLCQPCTARGQCRWNHTNNADTEYGGTVAYWTVWDVDHDANTSDISAITPRANSRGTSNQHGDSPSHEFTSAHHRSTKSNSNAAVGDSAQTYHHSSRWHSRSHSYAHTAENIFSWLDTPITNLQYRCTIQLRSDALS
jgi:hypothetical protein